MIGRSDPAYILGEHCFVFAKSVAHSPHERLLLHAMAMDIGHSFTHLLAAPCCHVGKVALPDGSTSSPKSWQAWHEEGPPRRAMVGDPYLTTNNTSWQIHTSQPRFYHAPMR